MGAIKECASCFCKSAARGIRVAGSYAGKIFWAGLMTLLTRGDFINRPAPEPDDRDPDIDDECWR
jgi:hypothetical protein